LLGNDHSLIHSAKVCLFVVLLGRKLNLTEEEQLSLMVAAIFHDIGRVNNSNDNSHGDKSIEKIKEYGFVFTEKVNKIISLYCKGDRKTKDTLIKIFKDADALDRVRTNDLDINLLRFNETKTLIETAKEIHKCLLKTLG